MSITLKCHDCAHEFDTTRVNAKYCPLCRLMRNLIYIVDKKYECWVCAKEFAPLERNDKLCGDCNTARKAHDTEGTCVFCKQKSKQLLNSEARVCRQCATDPDQRKLLIRAVKKKQDVRIAA